MVLESGVFVLQADGTLVPMQPAQFEAEVDFQRLLSKFPSLLVGDQISPENPRRFILIKQELSIGHEDASARWSLDHLFLDQDGIPTLVEVKRKSDSRLRREVVGQMLDYASNFQSSWNAEKISNSFEETCSQFGTESSAAISELLGIDTPPRSFWDNVNTNIQAGKLRLLFVADHIPSELRRIIEFLNKQMSPAEVLAIELRQFAGAGELRTIVPMIFGQTQDAVTRKAPIKTIPWTEDRLLETFDRDLPAAESVAARKILDSMKTIGVPLRFGIGRDYGSVYPLLKPRGTLINPAYLSTDGKMWLQFKHLQGKPVFGESTQRHELLRRFAEVEGSNLSEGDLDKWAVTIPLARIAADPQGTEKVISALRWIVERVKAAG